MTEKLEKPGKSIVVLASGSGGNFQALADWAAGGDVSLGSRGAGAAKRREGSGARPRAKVEALVSDNPSAFALARAQNAGIPAVCKEFKKAADLSKKEARRKYDSELAALVESFHPDFVFLLGWMRLLSNEFISRFPGKVVNLHPALPGAFPGTHAIERAFEAFKEKRVAYSGVMTHFVPDEGIDSGPVIAVQKVPILPSDDIEIFEKRVHETEHLLVVQTADFLISSVEPGTAVPSAVTEEPYADRTNRRLLH